MELNRIRVSQKADNYLRQMKGKTGLTPNLLCRLGFCLSLRDPSVPNPEAYEQAGAREFNRFTLLGQWDKFFVALLKERCRQDGITQPEEIEEQFKAHINRGILLLFQRMKDISDLSRLVDEAYNEREQSQ